MCLGGSSPSRPIKNSLYVLESTHTYIKVNAPRPLTFGGYDIDKISLCFSYLFSSSGVKVATTDSKSVAFTGVWVRVPPLGLRNALNIA